MPMLDRSAAIFELGRLSVTPLADGSVLLRDMAAILRDALNADVVTAAVCRRPSGRRAMVVRVDASSREGEGIVGTAGGGAHGSATSVAEAGAWLDELRGRAAGRFMPAGRSGGEGGVDPAEAAAIGSWPLGLTGDAAAVGVFGCDHGAVLVVFVGRGGACGECGDEGALAAEATRLACFVGDCFGRAWVEPPAWLDEVKPTSRAVLDGVLEGLDDEQIAERSGLTYHSVRAHLKRLFRAAGVRSRLHLMQACRYPASVGSDGAGAMLPRSPEAMVSAS